MSNVSGLKEIWPFATGRAGLALMNCGADILSPMRKPLGRLLGVVACLVLSAPCSSAECFILGPLCQEFKRAAAIVDGTVEERHVIPAQSAVAAVSATTPVVAPAQRARIRIHRAWKGVDSTATTVEMLSSALEDGVEMAVGRRYLFYAWRGTDGRLWAQGCGRTKLIEQAVGDIAFLDSQTGASREAGVFGIVLLRDERDADVGLGGVQVLLTQPAAPPRSVTTDATGRFDMTGVPAGRYTLSITAPASLRILSPEDGRETIEMTIRASVRGRCSSCAPPPGPPFGPTR